MDRFKHNTNPIYDSNLTDGPIESDRELIEASRSTLRSSRESATSSERTKPKTQSTSAEPKPKNKVEDDIEVKRTKCTHVHVRHLHYMIDACEDSYKKDLASSCIKMLAQVVDKCILSFDAGWPKIHSHPSESSDLNAYPVDQNVLEELNQFSLAVQRKPKIKLLVVDKEGEPKDVTSLIGRDWQGYWYPTAGIGGKTVRMRERIQNVLLDVDVPLPHEHRRRVKMSIVNDRKSNYLPENVLTSEIALKEIMAQEFPNACKINVNLVVTSDFFNRTPNEAVMDALGRMAECENVRQTLQMLVQVAEYFFLAFDLRVEAGSNYPSSRGECLGTLIAILQRFDGMCRDSGVEWAGRQDWWQPELGFGRSLIYPFPVAGKTERLQIDGRR